MHFSRFHSNRSIQRRARQGFSFAEVMFAVVILGIGFIMVAAVFPVAIQQTQATGEENIAAIAARDAADSITALPQTVNNPAYIPGYTPAQVLANPAVAVQTFPVFPPTVKNYVLPPGPLPTGVAAPPAVVTPFNGARWKLIQSDSVVISDQRYAYVPFYRRENGSGAAELIVISVAVRAKPIYSSSTDAVNNSMPIVVPSTVRGDYSTALTNATALQQTCICPDTISLGAGYTEGSSVSVLNPLSTPGKPTNRTYTFGRGIGLPTGSAVSPYPVGDPLYTQFELNPGDGLALTAGSNGAWGTAGAISDQPLASDSCTFNPATTLQPLVAYAALSSTPTNPAGQITLFYDPNSSNTPVNAAPGAFVIIADDYPGTFPVSLPYPLPANAGGSTVGALNGRIFRIASLSTATNPTGQGTIYNLDPAYGMRPFQGAGPSPDTVPLPGLTPSAYAKCYIVGQGQVNGTYTGGSQDIGVFATYFSVK